jgi:hypothetical protein
MNIADKESTTIKLDERQRMKTLHEQYESVEAAEYLPIQQWFIRKELKDRNHFNHSFLIHVGETIDKKRLQRALEKLNSLHDSLRAIHHGGKQYLRKESRIALIKELNIKGKNEEEIFKELTSWQNGFDIEKGYVWQSGILRGYEDGSERIFLAFHHIIFDAASWSIIREDLKALYEGKEVEKKGSSYRQWADAVREYGKSAAMEERAYWGPVQKEDDNYKVDWNNFTEKDDSELRSTRVDISSEAVKRLNLINNDDNKVDINDVLLGALGYSLYEVTGKKKNWITLEKQGREAIDDHLDISRTVGWFTTLSPVYLSVGKDIGETIVINKESITKVPHNGIGYGALYGYDNMPKILFNYIESIAGTEELLWQIRMGEAAGESMCPDNRFGNIVDINGMQRDGKIGFWIDSCLKEDNHELLCKAFKRNIEAITLYLHP